MSITKRFSQGAWGVARPDSPGRRERRRSPQRFRPAPPERFEERALLSITLYPSGPGGATGSIPDAAHYDSSLSASPPVLDGSNVDFTFMNNGSSSVTVGVATYSYHQTLVNNGTVGAVLDQEVFQSVTYQLIAAHASATIQVPLQCTVQYDAFVSQVNGTNTTNGTPVSNVVTYFTPQDTMPTSNAGPPVDAGYNTYTGGMNFQPSVFNTTQPGGLTGTLLSYALTTGPDGTPGGNSCTPPAIVQGDTATHGFWHNKNGQAIINAFGTTADGATVGQWLVGSFPSLFGSFTTQYPGLTSSNPATSDAAVASLFLDLFHSNLTLDQIMTAALSDFATSSVLNTSTQGQALAAKYGFNLSIAGTGDKALDIGTGGAKALGLPTTNGTTYSVITILQAANSIGLSNLNSAIGSVFDQINSTGDIG